MSEPQRYFTFIRAINVGGRRVTNDQLVAPFVDLGFDDVAAYQAAGNITFCTDDAQAVHPDRLRSAFAAGCGFDADVFVRSGDEVRAVVEAQPFTPDEIDGTEGRLQVSFLHDPPPQHIVDAVLALVPPEDLVRFVGREWHWLPARGVSDSQLPVPKIEQLLDGHTTMRTLGTITRMLSKFGA